MELNKIYNEDYLETIKRFEYKSIDLIITDAPYWHKKSPGRPYSERKQCNTKSVFSNSALYSQDSDMMKEMSDFTNKDIYKLLDSIYPKMRIMNGYFFCSEAQVPYYCKWADENELMFSILIWRKPLSIINKNRFSQNIEYCIRIYDYGTALNRLGNNELYDRVSDYKPIVGKDKMHPCEKPTSLMSKFILLSSKVGDVIYDPFCGSGSTLISCMEYKRNFVGSEISKEYTDIANKRIDNYSRQLSLF